MRQTAPEVLVVLGKGLQENGLLTYESIVTARAIQPVLHDNRGICSVIITGGQTAGSEYPSEAEQMVGVARRLLYESNMGSYSIHAEREAIDTRDNALKTKALMKEYEVFGKPYALMTWEYHMERSVRVFRRLWGYGPVQTIHADIEVMNNDTLEMQRLLNYFGSKKYKRNRFKENLIRWESIIDPGQLLPRAITLFTR